MENDFCSALIEEPSKLTVVRSKAKRCAWCRFNESVGKDMAVHTL